MAKHIEVVATDDHVVVRAHDVPVADSRRPRVLHETGVPPRYYLPLDDVRAEVLRPSSTSTVCPYKGTASYWSLEVDGHVVTDAAWTYADPIPGREDIAGLVCFYFDRVELYVDGERVEG